ncbi:Nudix_Hydrolase domain containing protein [uncultured Caudovirales phage]|uniref:Nudix_Hydrolase domain containing protein n=1 Tax=uncultured Caudovirales phage TaxID=2100421 RepID=A0A6J7WUJ8_9CAUD|nr:Nudix_Hydrolase domain containing protein [uncultured Caudovirales phage]
MSETRQYKRQIDRIVAKWAARQEVEKQDRWPSGTQGGKGGQFAPAKGGAGGSGHSSEHSGAAKYSSYADLFGHNSSFPGGDSPAWAAEQNKKPASPPPGAKPHLHVDDKGKPVTINYPSKASDPGSWTDAKRTATFTPGSAAPSTLNGVALKPWTTAPKTENEWAAVAGQDARVDAAHPFEPTRGKSVGAGVIIKEPDGRIWLTSPTNAFGGYKNTFPKGTVEHGLSMQASAIKEAYEETGLQVRITGVLGDYERTTSKARFYIAERVGGTPAAMGWESQAIRLATAADAPKLLNMGVDKSIFSDLEMEGFFEKSASGGKKGGHGGWAKQERWPAGTSLGGMWKTMDGKGLTMPPTVAGGLTGTNPQYQKKMNLAYQMAQDGAKTSVLDTAIELEKKVAAYKAEGNKTGHAKKMGMVSQYITQLASDLFAAPKAEAIAARLTGPLKISSLTHVGPKPGGSNPGELMKDGKGQQWLVKGNNAAGSTGPKVSDDRARNEVLAAKLVLAAGAGGVDMKLVEMEGKHGAAKSGPGSLGVASKMVDDLQKIDLGNPLHLAAVQKDFAVHAWLGNWDVLGAGLDNTRIDKNGNAVCIDPGGAILFRAQGEPKSAGAFDKAASDFETMRSTDQYQKKVYGGMSKSMLADSAQKLAGVTDDTIRELVKSYGPEGDKEKADLASTLIARRDAILAKAGLVKDATLASAPAAPAVAAPAPAAAHEPPKVIDAVQPAHAGGAGLPPKPAFDNSFGKADYYDAMAQKMLDAHAAGDVPLLHSLQFNKTGGPAWPAKTVNGKLMQPFHTALLNDLEKQKTAGAQAVSNGNATVTGKDGTTWQADPKGVLQPAAPAAAPTPVQSPTGKALSNDALEAVWKPISQGLGSAAAGILAADYLNSPADSPIKAMLAAAQKGDLSQISQIKANTNAQSALKSALTAAMTASAPTPIAPKAKIKPDFDDLYDAVVLSGMSGNSSKWSAMQSDMWNHAIKGDLDALQAMKPIAEPSKKMQAAMVKVLQGLRAPSSTLAAPTPQPVVTPAATLPGAPNFASAKLPNSNTNAPSHNKKVDAISAAFAAKDEKSILAMTYGIGSLSGKQVKLANDALAAMGSVHQVEKGQAKNSHPALLGGAGQPGTVAPPSAAPAAVAQSKARTLADLTVDKLPAPPDMMNFNGGGTPYSKHQWKNDANKSALLAMQQAAMTGGMTAVDALKFPELDPNTGAPTGKMLTAEQHPAKKVIGAYATELSHAINDFLNPPKKLEAFNVVNAQSVKDTAAQFFGAKIGTTVASQPKNHQFGFWLALGKVKDKALVEPTEKRDMTEAEYKTGYAKYKKYGDMTKKWISSVQSTGHINRAIDDGVKSYGGMDIKAMTKQIYADANPMPAGSTLYRWQEMPAGMLKQVESAEPGLVFQSLGGFCTSQSETATQHFGTHKLTIRVAPGAKAIHSHGSGSMQTEKEITTIPGQRYVLLSKKWNPNAKSPFGAIKPRWEIELLMLPPDDTFVS